MLARNIMFLAFLFTVLDATAQKDIVLKGDTLVMPNGSKFWLGEQVTLGNGSSPDKTFSFIYTPELYFIKKRQPLSAGFYNQQATIKKFERDGNYKKSYSYNILVLEFGDKKKYWCDIRGALDNKEIVDNFRVVAKEENTTANNSNEAKLLRLKKLLDAGDITKEEYETLKSKIPNDKGNASHPKKANNGPDVF